MSSTGSTASLVKPTDGLVSRLLNRRISTRISLWLARRRSPPSPDQVSVAAAALVALAGPLWAAGHNVLAGIAAQTGSILDGVDGEIARLTGRQSRAGGLLDTVLDRLADMALIAGAAVAAATQLAPPLAAWLAAMAAAADLMVSYIHCFIEKTVGRHPALIGRTPNIAGRDTRLLILAIAAILDQPAPGLAAVTALGLAYSTAKTLEALRELEKQPQG